jgi:microcystin-dependent protein
MAIQMANIQQTSWSNPPAYVGSYTNTTHILMGQTGKDGGSQSHNNMPPYLVVYIWKRIA